MNFLYFIHRLGNCCSFKDLIPKFSEHFQPAAASVSFFNFFKKGNHIFFKQEISLFILVTVIYHTTCQAGFMMVSQSWEQCFLLPSHGFHSELSLFALSDVAMYSDLLGCVIHYWGRIKTWLANQKWHQSCTAFAVEHCCCPLNVRHDCTPALELPFL